MGRYVPPEHEGIRSGNQLHKKLPPGRRKAGRNSNGQPQPQIQTVRFEMPFAVWCHGCAPPPTLIPQGVRFNAVKTRVGLYFSTPIWAFRIRHGACGKELEIRTDPKNTEYTVAEGGRKRDYGDDGSGGAGPVTTTILGPIVSEEESERRRADAFAALEGRVEDRTAAKAETSRVTTLRAGRDRDWEDPYAANRRIRRAFREERKVRKRDEAHAEEIQDRYGLGIGLVAENEIDVQRAKLVAFTNTAKDGISSEEIGANIGDAELFAAAAKPLFEKKPPLQMTRPSSSLAAGTTAAAHDKSRGISMVHTIASDTFTLKSDVKKLRNKSSSSGKNLSKMKLANLQAKLQGNTRAALDPFAVTKTLTPAQPDQQSQSRDETDLIRPKANFSSTPTWVSAKRAIKTPMTTTTAKPNILPGLKKRNASERESKDDINAADQQEASIDNNQVTMTATAASSSSSSSPKPQANTAALVDYESD